VAAPAPVEQPSLIDDAPWLLPVGALACFAGFALVAVMLLPGPFTARRRRRQLGIERDLPQVELSSMAERAVGMAERVLQKGNRTEKIADLLEVAGMALRPAEFVALVAGVAVLALLFGLLLGGPVVGLVLGVLALLMSFGLLDVKGQRRRTRFAEHLPDVLQLLVSSLRTGYGLGQAVDAVSQDAPEPIAAELRRVTVETRLGRELSDALDGVARRMRSPDFEMVVAAVRIHRTVGGNLAEIMANVGGTIRDRQRTARQVQALIGEGKLSAYILTALPVLLGLFMKLRNPEYFGALLHGGGLIALTLSGGLLVVGWLWFQKLVRIKF
jgi:tight adherence protein B